MQEQKKVVVGQQPEVEAAAPWREYEPPEVVEIGRAEDLIEGNGTTGFETAGHCCWYAGGGDKGGGGD